MKQLLSIAGRELRLLFCSPVGWLTLIVFTVHSGFSLMGNIDIYLEDALTRDNNDLWFTQRIFSSFRGVFHSVIEYFYLYIPFLTMGLMSREYSEGGIKLLFSSPIKTRDIVLGKFLTVIAFALMLVFVLLFQAVIVRVFILDSLDWPLICAGLLIVFLIVCLYGAIGLFISSLTSYQLVAAVGTFAVLFIMNNYLRTIVQNNHPEFLQAIIHDWLPPNRNLTGIRGILKSGELAYYIILTCLFVTFTWFRLSFKRKSRSLIYRFSVYSVVVTFAIVLGWFTLKPANTVYFDWTTNKENSPSSEQIDVMKKLPENFSIIRYVNVLERPDEGSLLNYPGRFSTIHGFQNRFKNRFEVKFIPYYGPTNSVYHTLLKKDSVLSDASKLIIATESRKRISSNKYNLKKLADLANKQFSWFNENTLLTAEEVMKELDISKPENKNVYLLKSGNQSVIIQNAAGRGADEQILTSALKGMLEGKPVISFLSGDGERSPFNLEDSGYHKVFLSHRNRNSMVNQGFGVDTISLHKSPETDSANIIIVTDPQEAYANNELELIDVLIQRGNNFFISGSNTSYKNLLPIIESLGVTVKEQTINIKYGSIDPKAVLHSGNKSGFLRKETMWNSSADISILDKKGKGELVAIPHAVSLKLKPINNGFAARPVIISGKDTIMYALTRTINGKEQRILVCGSADFLGNGTESIGYRSVKKSNPQNQKVAVALFKWLSNDHFPSDAHNERRKESFVIKSTGFLKLFLVGVFPLPFLIAGLFILKRRKNN